jgi:Matrixin
MNSDLMTAASNEGVAMDSNTGISGEKGFIGTISKSKENTVIVAGGFSIEGNLQSDLKSIASAEAATLGTASVLGMELFNPNVAQFIAEKDVGVEFHGISLGSGSSLGEFGMIATNWANARKPTQEPAYKLTGYRLDTASPKQLYVDLGTSPLGGVGDQLSAAANTWDMNTHENLFKDSGTFADSNDLPSFDTPDGQFTHAWTNSFSDPDIIAMTGTRYTRKPSIYGDDGKRYKEVIDSDCWYNADMGWRIGGSPTTLTTFDVQTIAVHELGHTIGLADLYQDSNSLQTMYGYNSGQEDRILNDGDLQGLWKLYGGLA